MPRINKPERLLVILRKACELQANDEYPVKAALAHVLGFDPSTRPYTDAEFLSRLATAHRLMDEIEATVRGISDINPDKYLRSVTLLRTILGWNDTAKWASYRSLLAQPETLINNLEFCVEFLKKANLDDEDEIQKQEITELAEETRALFDAFKESSLDPKAKHFILHLLQSVLLALNEYEILGADRLRDVAAYAAGRILQNPELFEQVKATPEFNRFQRLLFRIDQLSTLVTKATPMIDLVTKAAPMLIDAFQSAPLQLSPPSGE